MILLSLKFAPVDNVNDFEPVNTNFSSTVALKLKLALTVDKPPAFEKNAVLLPTPKTKKNKEKTK